MGDAPFNTAPGGEHALPHSTVYTNVKSPVYGPGEASAPSGGAFQNQLEHLPQTQIQNVYPRQPQSFNMAAMAQNLPHSPHSPIHAQSSHGPYGPASLQPPGTYQMQHPGYASTMVDTNAIAKAQQIPQAQYMHPPYNTIGPYQQAVRHSQMPPQYNVPGYYPFMGQPQSPQVPDPRGQTGAPAFMGNVKGEFSHYGTRTSEPASIPSYPRGPPRKPKQSGHALWVGNLPPAAQIEDLKDHFSRDATTDIESLFLISKSNCAFVNYRSEKACSDAMARFHDSRFHGVRLVCRLRRGTGSSSAVGTPTVETADDEMGTAVAGYGPAKRGLSRANDPESPTIVGGSHDPSASNEKSDAVAESNKDTQRAPERYFIVKSLTVQDLESSMRTGVWATQNHIESLLNHAYENTENVYLIFSANKSGEYFGYARMASSIAGQPVNLNTKEGSNEARTDGTPHSIETPATATAPKGRIIDDSARGTIFWEAQLIREDDVEQGEIDKDEEGFETTPGSNWVSNSEEQADNVVGRGARGLNHSISPHLSCRVARQLGFVCSSSLINAAT